MSMLLHCSKYFWIHGFKKMYIKAIQLEEFSFSSIAQKHSTTHTKNVPSCRYFPSFSSY